MTDLEFVCTTSRRATSEPSKYEFVPREKPITLRSLMTFTSGVPLAFASFETPPSQEQILEWLTGQAPLVPATVVSLCSLSSARLHLKGME